VPQLDGPSRPLSPSSRVSSAKAAARRYEGPVRTDFERLVSSPGYNGQTVQISPATLSALAADIGKVIAVTSRSGTMLADIGQYGAIDTKLASSPGIDFSLREASRLHAVVTDFMPRLGLPPTLHLFDRDGARVHYLHGLDEAAAAKIFALPEAPPVASQQGCAIDQFAPLPVRTNDGCVSIEALTELLDFVHHLRLPVLQWVRTSASEQRRYGAIDDLWRGPGHIRLRSAYCTMSCDLTFAAAIAICRSADGEPGIEFRDASGAAYAGFGQDPEHSERARTTWRNLLNGLPRCESGTAGCA